LQGIKEHFTKHLTRTEAKHLRSAFTKILDATEDIHPTATRSAEPVRS